jgi:hypothetical protein
MPIDHYSDDAETLGMVRIPDHDTSVDAAESVVRGASTLRNLIHRLLLEYGDQTDDTLRDRVRILGYNYGYSTTEKRRGELVSQGRVIDSGSRERNARGRQMILWHGLKDGELPLPIHTDGSQA